MEEAKEKGDLGQMFKIITDKQYILTDGRNFLKMQLEYDNLRKLGAILTKKTLIENSSFKNGLKITAWFSYSVAILSLIYVMYNLFKY